MASVWAGHGNSLSTLWKDVGTPFHRCECPNWNFSGHNLALASSFLACPPTRNSLFHFFISHTFPIISCVMYHVPSIFHPPFSFDSLLYYSVLNHFPLSSCWSTIGPKKGHLFSLPLLLPLPGLGLPPSPIGLLPDCLSLPDCYHLPHCYGAFWSSGATASTHLVKFSMQVNKYLFKWSDVC
jgi:hypothetical protein